MENGWVMGAAMLGAWGIEAAFIRLVGALVLGLLRVRDMVEMEERTMRKPLLLLPM